MISIWHETQCLTASCLKHVLIQVLSQHQPCLAECSALQHAAATFVECTPLLLECGAELDAQDQNGATALFIAARKGKLRLFDTSLAAEQMLHSKISGEVQAADNVETVVSIRFNNPQHMS